MMRRIMLIEGNHPHIIREPNSIIISLFIQNFPNYLPSTPPRRLSSKLLRTSRRRFRI